MPSSASVRNQITIAGANSLPTLPVPRFWIANNAVSTSSDSGTIKLSSSGAIICSPSMAESTEMAGVITPSP